MFFHVWFVTKYREPLLQGKIERKVKEAFLEVAGNKNYNILEMESNKDHAHMLLEAKDRNELSDIMRTLKCVSAKKILGDTPCLRMGNGRNNEGYHRRKPVEERKVFWAPRYGWREVSESGLENIRSYIRNQKRILHSKA